MHTRTETTNNETKDNTRKTNNMIYIYEQSSKQHKPCSTDAKTKQQPLTPRNIILT